ncbi:MAG: heat-inducible transcription repressor HrcA [Acidimicrobiia bacterium]|nr:heat-inducible transcription repressor HrcA [Acidimicrobiia bacterium]
MLDDRKAAVLRAVVREYIETAQPVGSAHVAHSTGLGVSPATVRNEMAALEREGYLTQPHTSAGRIPTDQGYRFFVDQLSGPRALPAAQRQQVREFFAKAHGELEQMLHDTSSLLSGLTSYAALILAPPSESATVRSVQVVGLTERMAMVVVVLSNGAIEKAMLELDADLGDEHLAAASSHLTAHLEGTPLVGAAAIPATGDRRLDGLVTAVLHALGSAAERAERDHDHVYVGGASRMASAFDAVDTVRQVLAILEQQYVVVSLLREVIDNDGEQGISVSIGTELGLQPLAECSIVVAPYQIEGESLGTVGVLGPTRMNYPQAMAAVAVVSERLGRSLSA